MRRAMTLRQAVFGRWMRKSDCDFKLYPSHVMFWLPFNGDVGIHDASWRTGVMAGTSI